MAGLADRKPIIKKAYQRIAHVVVSKLPRGGELPTEEWERRHSARQLDVPEDQLDPIRQAAELHDVGKVGIPDAILSKPGSLHDAEWEFMRRHPIIAGAPALAQVGRLCTRATNAGTARGIRTSSEASKSLSAPG